MSFFKSLISTALGIFNPATLFINLGISWVMGEIATDKQEKAIAEAEARHAGILINRRSNIANIPVIYGQRKVGGTLTFTASSGTDNAFVYLVLTICEGEISEIGDVYLDDILSTDSRFNGLVTINKHLGSDTQAADSMLIAANIGWTTAHQGKGVAYIACRLKYDKNAFSGIPTLHVVVTGRTVYDTLTSTTVYSDNPALCLRDYLTNPRYGKGLPASAIDDTLISAAATKCNALVTPYTGGTQQNLFTCNAVLDTSRTLMQNVKVLLSGMRGIMPYQQGLYSLVVEDELAASVTPLALNESHIIGGLSLQSGRKSTIYNKCIATFTNPGANWQRDQISWPPAGSAEEVAFEVADGEELIKRIELETITNPYTAEDIAEIVVRRSRDGVMVQFTATSEALQCTVPDIITVTHSTPGWTAKPFRILSVQLKADGTVGIEAVEHQDSIYPWSTKTQEDDTPDTNLPNPYSVTPPTPYSVTEQLYTTTNSKGIQSRAIFAWARPNDAFVSKYEAGYKLTTATDWTFITRTSALETRVDDMTPGQYDFRARSINTMGVESVFAVLPNQILSGLTAPPADIAGFSVRALDGSAHISWDRVTDLDVINGGFIRIRHATLTSGATWNDGTNIGEALAGTQTHVVLPLLAGTYMAKSVDSTGKFSTNAVFAITTVANILNFNTVETVTEHPGFAGQKTNMVAASNVLKLTGTTQTPSTGTYIFSAPLDLGQVFVSRVTANLQSSAYNLTDLVDGRSSNIDSWLNFDGEPSDKITADMQIRTTLGDPNSSPTWSDWASFLVGDYHARGFDFRVQVVNDDPSYQIGISSLSVTVDMPDRAENGIDLSVPASGSNITFNAAFRATPAVVVAMQNSASGDYFSITNISNTGFTLNCLNSSAAGISRTVNWFANGYGRAA